MTRLNIRQEGIPLPDGDGVWVTDSTKAWCEATRCFDGPVGNGDLQVGSLLGDDESADDVTLKIGGFRV